MTWTPKVQFLRWPTDAEKRELCRKRNILRLLVVEQHSTPPVCADVREDWIRVPATRKDVEARIDTLRARARLDCVPHLESDGILRLAGRSVVVSPSESALLEVLVPEFGTVVTREALRSRLSAQDKEASRNALDLHIKRLRRRIRPLGMTIRTAWGQGYVLETEQYLAQHAG